MWSDEESDDDVDDGVNDPDFHLSPVSATPSSSIDSGLKEQSKRAALNNFIRLMRPDRPNRSVLTTRSYNQLSKGSKKNFLLSARLVVDVALEFLAGNDADHVREELFSKESRKLIP